MQEPALPLRSLRLYGEEISCCQYRLTHPQSLLFLPARRR